ncbi:MAG: hypothetical protein ACI8ZX_001810 [Planctomycetota bacterium]|jgi:hypothetical protein
MNLKINILLLVVISVFTACNNVEGTYVANHNDGSDTLVIYSDKFVRTYYPIDKLQAYSDTGKWDVSNGHITFSNWKERSKAVSRKTTGRSINYGIDVSRSLLSGETKLIINYDLEYYYIKK